MVFSFFNESNQKNDSLPKWLQLYQAEKLSLRAIAERFGIKRQAVHEKFKRNGVQLRPKNQVSNRFELESLVELYEIDKLTIGQIAEKLATTYSKISDEMARNQISKRSSGELKKSILKFGT